jgi:hypothetical protein
MGGYVKLDLKEILFQGVDSDQLVQGRAQCRALMNAVIKLWFTQKAGNFFTS